MTDLLIKIPNKKMAANIILENPPHVSQKASSCPSGTELCVAVPVVKLLGLSTSGGCHLGFLAGCHLGSSSLLHLDTPDRLHPGTPCLFHTGIPDRLFFVPTLSPMGCQCPPGGVARLHCCFSFFSDPIWSFSSRPNCRYCFYSMTMVCASPSRCSYPGPSCSRQRSTSCALHMAASRLSGLLF